MADSLLLTQSDLIRRLLANLPEGYTASTVKLPNLKFSTPSNTKWLRVTNLPSGTDNVSACLYKRTFGIFAIDCFYPKDSGDIAQLTDINALKALYENKEFGNTITRESDIVTIGGDDSWYNVQLQVNYYYEGK